MLSQFDSLLLQRVLIHGDTKRDFQFRILLQTCLAHASKILIQKLSHFGENRLGTEDREPLAHLPVCVCGVCACVSVCACVCSRVLVCVCMCSVLCVYYVQQRRKTGFP